jgi:hypothetical protein
MPGDFEITFPQENDTLFLDEDFTVSWTTSENAERYFVSMVILYGYTDTAGNGGSVYLDSFFYTTDTSFIIPLERVLPSDIDSVRGGFGNVAVSSENGAWIGHSLEGNITGEGVGYFTAYNQINEIKGDIDFRIGDFSVSSVPFYKIEKISPRERFEKRLEYLMFNDPNFMQFGSN